MDGRGVGENDTTYVFNMYCSVNVPAFATKGTIRV